jgi:hypothetical protein
MDESKKPLVSVRLSHADLEKLDTIAKRLRARESEIIRFALRLTFAKLAPLLDVSARGRDLIPIFLECGPELTHHFDLDPQTLDAIINGALENPQKRVEREDIDLISTLHMPSNHPRAKLKGLPKREIGQLSFSGALQHYLYEKYVEPGNELAGLNNVCANFLQVPL